MTAAACVLPVLLSLLQALHSTHGQSQNYSDYYYSNYDAQTRDQMFIPGASIPALFTPFTIAILNPKYCAAADKMIGNMNAVFKRMMIERNIRLHINCNYTSPNTIFQAVSLYRRLVITKFNENGVDALMGDYNPLVSTIAATLGLQFLIVDFENTDYNSRLLTIANMYYLAPPGTVVGPFADLNNYTFAVDSFWYRNFLFSSILSSTDDGTQVFGSLLQNFQQLGIICDDSVLLSQFVTVDRGPFISSLITTQLDSMYPITPSGLNNVSAISMDSWTSKYAGVTALLISTNTTYSATLLPQILESLLYTGFFSSQTITVVTNVYIPITSLVAYSDTQSSIFTIMGPQALGINNMPFPSFNVTLPLPANLVPTAPLVIDPTVATISTSLYYLSMQLIQKVYKSTYIDYAIANQNWPGLTEQNYFLKYKGTYGISALQYNRCQYLDYVFQVTAPNCTSADLSQSPQTLLGLWVGSDFLFNFTSIYSPKNYSTSSSNTSQSSSATRNNTLLFKSLKVGLMIDNPWVISCQECPSGFQGYAIDVLGNLSITLKFNYSLFLYPNYQTLMSRLSQGSLDMAIGGFLWTNSTTSLYGSNVTLMMPFLDSGVNMLIRNDTKTLWWTWIYPYSNVMWFTMLILATILTFSFMILDTIDPNRLGKRLLDFFASYWYVFGAFTQSAVEIMPVTVSTKLLSMVMWFTVIIYVSAYTAAYASSLIEPTNSNFAASVTEALNYFRYSNNKYYFTANSSASMYLQSTYSDLYARAMQNQKTYLVNSAFEAAGHLIRDSSLDAFVGDARVNQWMSNLVDCWLITLGDINAVYSTYYSIIALPLNTTYYTTIFQEMVNLERFRVLSTMKAFYFDSQCTANQPPQSLSLTHLAGLYMVLAGGTAFSLFTTIVVIVWKKLKLRAERDAIQRQQPFHFGQRYVAKIMLVRDNGLMLKIYRSEKDEMRDRSGKKPEHSPLMFAMTLADLNVGNAKTKKPVDLHLRENGRILVKYLGVNPESDTDRFIYYKNLDSGFYNDEQ